MLIAQEQRPSGSRSEYRHFGSLFTSFCQEINVADTVV
jgi:hypothetical protein